MKKQRTAVFDIAKLLAIFLVVLGHLLNECVGDPTILINFFHMPVLFFISGYFAAFSQEKYESGIIVRKKIKSLLLPYLFWSGVSLAANLVLGMVKGSFDPAAVLQEAAQIFLYARSVWFLAELLVSFLVFLTIHELVQRTEKLCIAVPAQFAAWLLLSCMVPGEIFAFYKFKWLYPFFMVGWIVARKHERVVSWLNSRKNGFSARMVSLTFPVLVSVFLKENAFWEYTQFTYSQPQNVFYGILYYLISLTGVGFVMTLSYWISKTGVSEICSEIGTYSMDIYVIHMFIVKVIQIIFVGTGMGKFAVYALYSGISLLIVVFIWLMSKWILRKIGLFRIMVGLPPNAKK